MLASEAFAELRKCAAWQDIQAQRTAHNDAQAGKSPFDVLGGYMENVTQPVGEQHKQMLTQTVDGAMQNPGFFGDTIKSISSNAAKIQPPMVDYMKQHVPQFLQKSAPEEKVGAELPKSLEINRGGWKDTVKSWMGMDNASVESGLTGGLTQGLQKGVSQAVNSGLGLNPGGDPAKSVKTLLETGGDGVAGADPNPPKTSAGTAVSEPVTRKLRQSIAGATKSNLDTMPWAMNAISQWMKPAHEKAADTGQAQALGQSMASKISENSPAIQSLGKSLAGTVNQSVDQFSQQHGNTAFQLMNQFSKDPWGGIKGVWDRGAGGIFDFVTDYGQSLQRQDSNNNPVYGADVSPMAGAGNG